jgi:lactoylglutathione lyase
MDIIHVCLNVSDADRLAEWYTEQLGLQRAWEFSTEDGTRNVYVSDGDGFELQLSESPDQTDLDAGSAWDHLAVSVEDVDTAFDAIDHHGVVKEPTYIPGADARVAFIEDPDGHVVELVEPQ